MIRLQNLDLNLLIVLDIMIAEQSVSQTGQRLNMTQPAISNALSRLRQHFDDELFVVMGRRMAPTPLCDSLAEPVRKVLADLRAIASTRATFDPAEAERTITIICSDYVFLVFLAEAIRKLAPVAPGLKIRTLLTNEGMTDLLRGGRADFGIFPERRMVEGLPHTPLFEDAFSVISWRDNSQIKDVLTREQYLRANHVSASIGPNTPLHIEQESLDQHGVIRNIAVYAPNFTGVAEVVVGTDYIATMHSRAARMLATRMPLRVHAPPWAIAPFTVALQWNPSRDGDPGMTWIRNFLITCGEQL